MKKIYYLFAVCCALMALNACSLKEDANFDETASQRSEENIEAVRKILYTAPNGWLMEYYGNRSFGGYNVMMKFDGDQVTIGSEKIRSNHVAGIDTEGNAITSTSHFKLEQSMGTILSFDEWNDPFHYYSMPNNPDGLGSTDEGLLGDFEFRVMKASQDSIILRGKKHNNRIIMTPIPADKTWASIIREAAETETYMSSSSYTLTGADYKDTIEIKVQSQYRCLYFQYTDSAEQKQTITAPYIVQSDGYKFYEPVEVDGMELDGLLKGTTDDYFVFRNNKNLQLDSYMPTLAEHLTTGLWTIRYSSLGAYATPKWDAMMEKLKTAGKNKTEIKIYYAYLGVAQEKLGCHLSTSTDAPYWCFTTKDISASGDRITLVKNTGKNGHNRAGEDYYKKYAWQACLDCMYGHTFKLTCDYPRRPSYITMTDVNDPTNVITVWAGSYYFMDDMSYYQDN